MPRTNGNGQVHSNGSALEIAWSPEEAAARSREIAVALAPLGIPAASINMTFPAPDAPPPFRDEGNGKENGKGNGAHRAPRFELPDADDPDEIIQGAVDKQQWVKLPISGKRLSTDELIQVDDDTWLDPGREAVWKIKVGAPRGGDKKITWRRIKSPSGAPVLHEIVRPMGKGLKEPDGNEATFIVSWSDRPEVGKVEIGGKALHEGSAWRDHWTDLGISRRSDINFYERIVQLQARPFKVSNHAWPRHTGFVEKPVDGWCYTMPDGRQVSLAGVTEKGRVAGYNFPRASDWRGYNPRSPAPSEDEISGVFSELVEIDGKGRLLALIGLEVRGMAATTSPVRTCGLLMGDPRSGKTSSANLARGVIGPCGPGEPDGGAADATFAHTITAIELRIAALRDVPILLDDARKRGSGSPHETSEITLKLERLITSAAQDEPVRERSNQSLAEPRGVTVKGALMLTAESSLVGRLDESRLLRVVLLRYDRGEIDHETLRSEWRRLQSTLSAAGLAVMRSILRALSDRPQHELADAIALADEVFFAWIRKNILAAIPGAEPEFVASISMRYSRLLTGMLMIDRACGCRDYQACNALLPHVGALIREQLDFIAHGGGAGGVDRDFMLGAIRWAFSHGAYLLGPDGRPATEMSQAPGNLLARGYGWREGKIALTGTRLIGRYANRGGEYLIADVLLDFARDYSKSLGRELPCSARTFSSAAVQVGLAQRRGERNAPRVRIGGERYYALFIGDSPETEGTEGTHAENHNNINALTLSPLPDLGGVLRELEGTHFCQVNQHVTGFVPSVPSVSGVSPYRVAHREAVLSGDNGGGGRSPSQASEKPASDGSRAKRRWSGRRGLGAREASRASQGPTSALPPLGAASSAPEPAAGPRATPDDPRTMVRNDPEPELEAQRVIRAIVARQEARAAAREARSGPSSPQPDAQPTQPGEASGVALTAPGEATRWPQRLAALDGESLCLLAPDGSIERRAVPLELRPETACTGRLAAFAIDQQITQLWLHPSYTRQTDLPPKIGPTLARKGIECDFASDDHVPQGWRLTAPGKLRSWNRLVNGRQEVHLVAAQLDSEVKFGTADDAATMLEAVSEFHGAMSFWYRIDPAVMLEAMLRTFHRKGLDLTAAMLPAEFPEPMRSEIITEQVWARSLTEQEIQSGRFAHTFDKRATYLACMSTLAVGFGTPDYVAAPTFDPRKTGYWRARITMPDTWPDYLPHPGETRPRQNGAAVNWHVTPTLTLARELGAKIEVQEAWLFNETHQPFAPVYRRLREARQHLSERSGPAAKLALSAVKSIYTKGIGNLASHSKRDATDAVDLYRPDWRHAIVALARANILRNIMKAGVEPFGIRTDAIHLISPSDDPLVAAKALRQGPELGQWSHIGVIPLERLPAAFTNGQAIKSPQRHLDELKALSQRRSFGDEP